MATIYINVNPRNVKLALVNYLSETTKAIAFQNPPDYVKMLTRAKSCAHKASENSALIVIDVDTKDPKHLQRLAAKLAPYLVGYSFCVETTNGYHLVFDRRKLQKLNAGFNKLNWKEPENMFQEKDRTGKLITKTYMSISGEPSVVIPGTLHRGFPARFVNFGELSRPPISRKNTLNTRD